MVLAEAARGVVKGNGVLEAKDQSYSGGCSRPARFRFESMPGSGIVVCSLAFPRRIAVLHLDCRAIHFKTLNPQ